MHASRSQSASFKHSKLVEDEIGVIAGTSKVTVPSAALLAAVGWAYRAIHVRNNILQAGPSMKLINPMSVQFGKGFEIGRYCKCACLKASHLRWRGCSVLNGAASDNLPHYRVLGQLFGVVAILISGQSAKNALPK